MLSKILFLSLFSFQLFASGEVVSIGSVIVSLPKGHSFKFSGAGDKDESKAQGCFRKFIEDRVAKISDKPGGPSIFSKLSGLGYYSEIRLGKRENSRADDLSFKFSMRDLGEKWCDQKAEDFLFKKLEKEVLAKVKRVLGKRLVESLPGEGSERNFEDCDCVDLSDFKLDEEAATIYHPDKSRVKNASLKKKLFSYFFDERKAGRTTHIIPGTQFSEIIGGSHGGYTCYLSKYKLNRQGEIVLDYCEPIGVRLSAAERDEEAPQEDETSQDASSSEEENDNEGDSGEGQEDEESNDEGDTEEESEEGSDEEGSDEEEPDEEGSDEEGSDEEGSEEEGSEEEGSDEEGSDDEGSDDEGYDGDHGDEDDGGSKKQGSGDEELSQMESPFGELMEHLATVNFDSYTEDENGVVYNPEGEMVTNETELEMYHDQMSDPQDIDTSSYTPQVVWLDDEDSDGEEL